MRLDRSAVELRLMYHPCDTSIAMPVSLRVPPQLKRRIQKLAAAQSSTAHAFMLEAIAEKVDADEARLAFIAEAEHRLAEARKHGKTIPADEVFAYLEKRLAGAAPKRPTPRRTR